jgi:hypothetical protein
MGFDHDCKIRSIWHRFLFFKKKVSLFIDSGGGIQSMSVENKENQYAIASSWIGSGVTFRMGTVIYLNLQ